MGVQNVVASIGYDRSGPDLGGTLRPGDVLQYTDGSEQLSIERDSFAGVLAVDARTKSLMFRGMNVFEEPSRAFATGDRLQFPAQKKEVQVANHDLGTVRNIESGTA